MLLVVGLGNPGPEYARNRHNIGFMAADEIVRRHSFSSWKAKFQGEVAEGSLGGTKVVVLKPRTFMNLSGQAVGQAARFLKIPVADIVVLHDELDLAPGKIRVKRGGGSGGHNGLRSIDAHLGPDYRRVRMGIGHPGHKDLVHNWVLHDFAKADLDWLDPLLGAVADALGLIVDGDDGAFMSRVAMATQPPKPKPAKKTDEAKADKQDTPSERQSDL